MDKLANISDAILGKVASFPSPEADLFVFQGGQNISFSLKRMFTILAKEPTSRGSHAHKECAQSFFCPVGACAITLDDGQSKKSFLLDGPDKILFMPPGLWGEQDYLRQDTILIVLCDKEYDEEDYLRDYDAFLQYRAEQK